ncbi:hypothetical protein MB02_01035 [Croceicoccus estronivorus]|uniref:SPOR domain-containing protein n=1 Tax=Croceicoccus estronivorus TaxID=1172626 RepID=UPI00082F9D83|nr:SPOR domain-containing protein [Croceicoccus estronivorus]OCC25289.1 hypothetical protein MB02_01035 [Croceicoccus estronivorus]
MKRNANHARTIGLTLVTALASTALAGCTMASGPRADASASRAEVAMKKGHLDKAIDLAEQAVMSNPNEARYRAVLGTVYLNAGRFDSAATSYNDAIALGDTSARTALSLALAEIGAGQHRTAVAVLDDRRDDIDAADLGLAYALADEAERGVKVLADTLRNGENTPKVRQNLAYAYALAGEWKQARIMAAQDVSADKLDERISQWAMSMRPDAYKQRVAGLLNVPMPDEDPGQPAALALRSSPVPQGSAAQTAALDTPAAAPVSQPQRVATSEELPALPSGKPRSARQEMALVRYEAPSSGTPNSFEAAFAEDAPKGVTPAAIIADTVRFVSKPMVQALPAHYSAAPRRGIASATPSAKTSVSANGNHLVQLGSFYSKQSAREAWNVYARRNPGLGDYRMQITEAVVNGKHYWRVSAAGFGKTEASAMCARIKARGQGCIPYTIGKPLPGAVS